MTTEPVVAAKRWYCYITGSRDQSVAKCEDLGAGATQMSIPRRMARGVHQGMYLVLGLLVLYPFVVEHIFYILQFQQQKTHYSRTVFNFK